MANTDGQIVLGLDKPKTVKQINEDIKKLQSQLVQIKATGALDTNPTVKKINAQIAALQSQLKTININVRIDTNNAIRTAQQTGQQIGQTVADAAQSTLNTQNINIDKLNADVKTLANNLNSFSSKNAGFDHFKTEINGVEVSLESLISKLSTVDNATDLSTIRSQAAALKTSFTELSQINEIQLSMTGRGAVDYNWQVDEEIKKLKNLGFTEEEVAQQVKVLTDAHIELKRVIDSNEFDSIELKNKAIIESDKERTLAINQVKNAYKEIETDATQYYNLNKQTKLSADIQNWLSKNSGASKEATDSLNAYYRELSGGRVSVDRLNYIEQELREIDAAQRGLRGLSKLGKYLKDQFKEASTSFTQWLSVSSAVTLLLNQLRKMPKEVYEIDTAMTNLYKVTDETEDKYIKFLDSASESAYKLGRSVSSLVELTTNWAKLGFSIDEASKLAEISSIYANVGEVDDGTAVSDIVTAMKAFNIEAENSITIIDSLTRLGNEFATDTKSLGEGLRNSASSMAAAGNDINQTLAILTGGSEITQNVAELSNGLQVVSMRLRGMKDALQEIGEEYEDIESVGKIQTQIYDLTKGTVNIFKDNGTFKSTYEQLKEISEIYFDLSDSDRADLTEIMFGKNRANQGIAILQAFESGQIQKAYEASVNSAGSAYEEQSRGLESLKAKTQQFEAAFQSLSNTVLDSDMLKGIVDLGTKGVSSLEGIAKALEYINSLGGQTNSTGGLLGAVSGLIMNKIGIGERTMFQW